MQEMRGTTILAVKDDKGVSVAGDGQVTLGQAIARHRKPVLQDEDYLENLEEDAPIVPPTPHIVEEPLEPVLTIGDMFYYKHNHPEKGHRHFFE